MLKVLQEVVRFAAFLNARPNFDELLIRLGTDFFSHLDPRALSLVSITAAKRFEPIQNWGEAKSLNYQDLENEIHSNNLVATLMSQGLIHSSKGSEKLISPISNGKVAAGAITCDCTKAPETEDLELAKTIMALSSTYLFPKIVDNNHSIHLLISK